jgi:methylated-DNA-[protein]-cysteine S-methyltransferase
MVYSTHYLSPVGEYMIVSDGENIIGAWMVGQKYFARNAKEEIVKKAELPVFTVVKNWLDRYFIGEKPTIFELPLLPKGSKFQQDIWDMLCEIPYGEITTYKAIARNIASLYGKDRMSAQAVGGAVGHNPISIIIPCHRVIGSDGSLTGYAGGIDAKLKLLEHEGVDMSILSIPKKTI